MDLRQKEVHEWQKKNFTSDYLLEKSKEELVEIIYILQMALGVVEEAGEIAHHVLKGTQHVRGGVDGIDKKQVADGVGDNLIFGMQLLSFLGVDAEKELPPVIESVLSRNWVDDPENGKSKERKLPACSIESVGTVWKCFNGREVVVAGYWKYPRSNTHLWEFAEVRKTDKQDSYVINANCIEEFLYGPK